MITKIKDTNLDFEPQYLLREISWLYFNHRVLQETMDLRVPLYERINFMGVFSSNLDEYYSTLVAALRSLTKLEKKNHPGLNYNPSEILHKIHDIVSKQQQEFGSTFASKILPELENEHNTLLTKSHNFTDSQQEFATNYFRNMIAGHLSIDYIQLDAMLPFLKNKGIYFVVALNKEFTSFAIVPIPSEKLGRFVILPEHKGKFHISFLDDIIRYCLPSFMAGFDIHGIYSIKISRDASIYIEDNFLGDLLKKIRIGIAKRNIGTPIRFLYDGDMPDIMLKNITTILELEKDDLVTGHRYHNFSDFTDFPNPSANNDLYYPIQSALSHPILKDNPIIIPIIQKQDILLHFPYQKFDYIPSLIEEAANTNFVEAIKITLYRLPDLSKVVKALLYALKQGKEVFVFIEVKARFEEASNLYWGKELEKAGAKVLYNHPGTKIHSKTMLIKTDASSDDIAYLSTGNFNELTSNFYSDHGLFTSDRRITDDVSSLFSLIEGKASNTDCKHILTSPKCMRRSFYNLIDTEIKNAKEGKTSYIIAKMNVLEDHQIINKLYEASCAGVQVQLIIRAVCCLVPGVKNLSENIEVISIIDRYLEHSRIYIFANGGEEKMYLSSANWISQSLDEHIEVAFPVYDDNAFLQIRHTIQLQLMDNVKARNITIKNDNSYREESGKDIRAQKEIYYWLQKQ